MKLKTLQKVQDALNDLSLLTEENTEVQDLIMCIESYMDDIRGELEWEEARNQALGEILFDDSSD